MYPRSARNRGFKGKVVLHLIIGGDRKVKEVSVWSGPSVLPHSVPEIVKGWRYQHLRLNGNAVEVDTIVTLNYDLDPSPNMTVDNSMSPSFSRGDAPCAGRRLPPPPADGNVAAPASMMGQFRNSSYQNTFFGITYTPDAKLVFNTSTFFATFMPTPTLNSFGLFSALGEERIGRGRIETIAFAERLLMYPEGCRDLENILWRVVQNQRGEGYQVLNEKKVRQLWNTSFLEADFRRGEVNEAVLLTSRKSYVLTFIFAAFSSTGLDTLVSSSRIAFTDAGRN